MRREKHPATYCYISRSFGWISNEWVPRPGDLEPVVRLEDYEALEERLREWERWATEAMRMIMLNAVMFTEFAERVNGKKTEAGSVRPGSDTRSGEHLPGVQGEGAGGERRGEDTRDPGQGERAARRAAGAEKGSFAEP